MSAFFRKCLFVSFLFACFSAIAQQEQQLSELVVSTTKLPQKETQLTKSAIVLSDSVIRANAALSLSALLQKQAGIYIVGAGQPQGSVQSLFNRGAGSGYTLLLIDGVPMYEPSAIENNFDLNLLNLSSIDRIEILKGGQSTICGSDAVAGVINLITRKETKRALLPKIRLAGGSFKTLEAQGGISGKIKGFNYDLTAAKHRSEGFSAAVSDLAKPENDGFDKTDLSAALSRQIGAFNVSAFGRNSKYKVDLDDGAFSEEKDYVADIRQTHAGLGADFVKQKVQLHLKSSWSKIDREYKNDSGFVAQHAFAKYIFNTYGSTAWFADLFGQVALHKNINLLVGVDYRKQAMAQTYFSISKFGPYEGVPITKDNTKIENSSLYTVLKSVTDFGLGLELSGRLNKHLVYGINHSWAINPYFQMNERLMFFAVFGESFKNPSLYQLGSPYGNKYLKPEEARDIELGLRLNLPGSTQVNASVFDRNMKELIVFYSINEPPYGRYINLDRLLVKGFELNVQQKIGVVSLTGNYTALHGFIIDTKEKQVKTELIRRPKQQFNVGVTVPVWQKLFVSADVNFVGKRFDRFYNSKSESLELIELKKYALVGLNLRYKIRSNFECFATAQNLLNTKYTEVYGYNSQGQNIKVGILFN